MKLLTLNAHSLQGEASALETFVQGLLEERPDLVALQEVNQTRTAPPIDAQGRAGYLSTPGHGIPLRRDNYAAGAARLLHAAGIPCSWTWLAVKRGYERYDEGLALLSLSAPLVQTRALLASARDDYADWRTRKILGARLEGHPDWFYSVHLGWWEDADPFAHQWSRLESGVAEQRAQGPVWLLGDFNAPAHIRGQGYDRIAASGWQDTYQLAETRDGGGTVQGPIDGWRDACASPEMMRMDYIWCSAAPRVRRSQVLFNGKNRPKVSDHFGVLAETEEL